MSYRKPKDLCIRLQHVVVHVKPSRHVPARNPVRRTSGRVCGKFISTKNGRPVGWESGLELKACAVFEFSPAVKSYKEQPVTLKLFDNGVLFHYTPDFLLILYDGSCVFVEVKPAEHLARPDIAKRLEIASRYLYEHDSDFIVLTETELENATLQYNLGLLKPYIRVQVTKDEIGAVVNLVENNPKTSFRQVSRLLNSRAKPFSIIANHYLTIDFNEELSPDSLVFLPKENHHVTTLFSYRRML